MESIVDGINLLMESISLEGCFLGKLIYVCVYIYVKSMSAFISRYCFLRVWGVLQLERSNSPIEHLTLSWVNIKKLDSHILKEDRNYARDTTNFSEVLCIFSLRIVMTNIHYYTPSIFKNLLLA